jgi:proline iminopeptidase
VSELYPLTQPYDGGLLDVGDGNLVHWEVSGNPDGKPAVVLHGGPGSACTPGHRRYFDPERYRLVLFDQRGCGRSTPSAGDPATEMRHNTTDHLVADLESLREHLGIERWLLSGASWGSTLLLAYAERYSRRVSEIVINAVTFTRRSEIDWLYRGLRCFFPEEWERFRAGAGATVGPDGDLLTAYTRLLADPDRKVRELAALDWHAWEDATVSLDPNVARYSDRPLDAMLSRARICAHYFAHDAWLAEGVLLREASRLAGIPGVLIHGRFDIGSPLANAWDLARAWPDAELHVIDDSGHSGSATMAATKRRALDRFAER